MTAAVGLAAALVLPATADEPPVSRLRLSAGHDTFLQTYYLATDDTTETITEFNLAADYEARSRRQNKHQWHWRTELVAGSQLRRELFDVGYRWQPATGKPRVRTDLSWAGRQYRADSDYGLNSDTREIRGDLYLYPWYGRRAGLDLRLRARRLDHSRPSVLEQDYREVGAAAFLNSRGTASGIWRCGLRATQRAYPDSAAIDRETFAVEGDLDRSLGLGDLWLYHRSERRLIADENARPSAWLHWDEARLAVPAGSGHVIANLNSEVWRYDRETTVWFDAWRTDLELGYRWGDLLRSQQQVSLTGQRLAAGASPEAYTQAGLRGSIEAYHHALSGILSLEVGRRWYRNGADDSGDPTGAFDLGGLALAYSDFTYLEIWIMATWTLNDRWSLDLTASYQPERHTEPDDNTVLGFSSLRLAWRP